MKHNIQLWLASGLFICAITQSVFAQETLPDATDALTEQEAQYQAWAEETLASLTPRTGSIDLPGNVATLSVPDNYYYLDPTDSQTVLVDIWENPPHVVQGVLGMLFPASSTPFDAAAWGVTIEYVEEGYVSDADADDINYADLLEQMKEDTALANEARLEQGYQAITLIGWATEPYYDANTNKLYWAKEVQFGNAEPHTLNYNIRVLGRKGVLVLNFIAGMDQLDTIDANLDNVLAMAEFKEGSQYDDFNPDIDEVAAYGLGGLVAGKVLAKTGILAMALVFLKKFWLLIPVVIASFWRKLWGRKAGKAERSED